MTSDEAISAAYCDECGPAVKARVIASLPSGNVLAWCRHCGNKHRERVEAIGGLIYATDSLGETT